MNNSQSIILFLILPIISGFFFPLTAQTSPDSDQFWQNIHTGSALDESILNALTIIRMEDFIPEQYHSLAYTSTPIPLGSNAFLPSPEDITLLLSLIPEGTQKVTIIGVGTGYLSLLCTLIFPETVVYEASDQHLNLISAYLLDHQQPNIRIYPYIGNSGIEPPVDSEVIIIHGAVEQISFSLLNRIGPNEILLGAVKSRTGNQILVEFSDNREGLNFRALKNTFFSALSLWE